MENSAGKNHHNLSIEFFYKYFYLYLLILNNYDDVSKGTAKYRAFISRMHLITVGASEFQRYSHYELAQNTWYELSLENVSMILLS